MTGKKRALWVTSSFPKTEGDSTAPFLMEQARGMLGAGWEVDVLAPHAPGLKLKETIGEVTVYRYRYMWPQGLERLYYGGGALGGLKKNIFKAALIPIAFLALFFATQRRIRTARAKGEPYSMLHSHWIIPQGLMVGLASRLAGLPHICTGHGSDLSELRARPLMAAKRFALSMCDVLHVVTPRLAEFATDLDKAIDPVVVPLGVDFEAGLARRTDEEGTGRNAPILFLGRLSPEKGADVLIESLPHLVGEAADRPVAIVGGGPQEEMLKRRTSELGLQDKVTFVGMVAADEARAWIRRSAVMVIPSRHEGQGMVSMEAQAIGTPIVSAAVGGLPDSLNGGKAARMVPPEDPKALAAAISDVFSNPVETSERVENGVAHVHERFGQQKISAIMAGLYERAREVAEAR